MTSWLDKWRKWRFQRRSYFMLDVDKLRPGDIIFSTERAASSFLIRIRTRSKYSHASIYLGDGLYAEAVDVGVRTRAATTMVKEQMKVIRLKGGAETEQAAEAAAERINYYLHAPYALPSAILSVISSVPSADSRALFCSQLIAQSYFDIGIAVAKELPPTKVTPAILSNSGLFDDVTETVRFRTRAVPEHLVFGHFETLSDRETKIVENMYQKLRPFFEQRGMSVPPQWIGMLRILADLNNPSVQKDLDFEVITTMRDAGYISLLGAVGDEVIQPFAEWLIALEPSKLTDQETALYKYTFINALPALKRQAEIDLGNLQFWTEEWQRTKLGTFQVLAKYSDTERNQRLGMIKMVEKALEKLRSR
jgi:hypothetical protein